MLVLQRILLLGLHLQKKSKNLCKGTCRRFVSEGFEQKIEYSLDLCLAKSSIVVTGTGWASDLEHLARQLAFSRNIRSVAVLDHWVNYRERFERNGNLQLPEEIWVSDTEAAALASRMFPKLPVKQLPNYWLQGLSNKVDSRRGKLKPRSPATRLLYLLEPIRVPWSTTSALGSEAGEFQGLRYWLEHLPRLIDQGYVAPVHQLESLKLRPNPSESVDKYDSLISEYNSSWPISLDSSTELADSLAWADATFGCETQALVAAMFCGIPAFSTVPPWAPPCRLPQSSLNHHSRMSSP